MYLPPYTPPFRNKYYINKFKVLLPERTINLEKNGQHFVRGCFLVRGSKYAATLVRRNRAKYVSRKRKPQQYDYKNSNTVLPKYLHIQNYTMKIMYIYIHDMTMQLVPACLYSILYELIQLKFHTLGQVDK